MIGLTIRPLQPSDFEPLHALYNSLVLLIPHHPQVGFAQFEEQLLLTTSDKQPHAFLPESEVAFVAEHDGRPCNCYRRAASRRWRFVQHEGRGLA